MQRLCLVIAVLGALSLAAAGAITGAPPLVNQTDHPIDAALAPDIGIDCGTGQLSLILGSYSGVIHTLVKADGTIHVTGAIHGNATNDDLPLLDGIDASTTFVSTFADIFSASGAEIHQFTLNGSGTTTATGAQFGFHVLIQMHLDTNGNPTVDSFRLTCF
jgi:hypothetical protein